MRAVSYRCYAAEDGMPHVMQKLQAEARVRTRMLHLCKQEKFEGKKPVDELLA